MKKKVLLIEDEASIRTMFSSLFEKAGFEVITAENGQVGVQQAIKENPAIILCDIMMPVQNGIQTVTALKADPKTKAIKIIMLTNQAEDEFVKQAIELGAESYFIKSNEDPHDIVLIVKGLLKA